MRWRKRVIACGIPRRRRSPWRFAHMIQRLRTAAFVLALLVAVGYTALAAAPSDATKDWPQLHGHNRDNISRETGLLKQWPQGGPPLAWKIQNIGAGFSSVAV